MFCRFLKYFFISAFVQGTATSMSTYKLYENLKLPKRW